MIKKCLILAMLFMLLMPLAGVSAADAGGLDYCQIMPAPDCEILVNSEAAMAEVRSFAFDMDMSLHLLGEGNESQMLVTGSGRIAADPEAIAALNNMEGLDSADADAMTAGLESLLTGIEGEVSLLLTEITTDETDAEKVSETPVNLIIENGIYALDLASLVEASGEGMEGMEDLEWLGIDLTGAAASILAESAAASMFDAESGMMNVDASDLAESMTITRLPDDEVNGVAVAVFELSIDYVALLEVIDLTAMIAGMNAGKPVDQSEVEAMLESIQDATLVIREHIGLEDFYAYRIDIAAESTVSSFALGIELGDFNAPVDVDIPADTFVLPYALLTQMQMGASN